MRTLRIVLSVLVVAAAAVLVAVYSVSLHALNLEKRRVIVRTRNAPAWTASPVARQNSADLAWFARFFPWDAELHELRAANFKILGRNDEAAAAYAEAIRNRPTPELYFRLGELQLATGRTEAGLANLRHAVVLDARHARDAEPLIARAGRANPSGSR